MKVLKKFIFFSTIILILLIGPGVSTKDFRPEVQPYPIIFIHESFHSPELVQLRKQYDYDEYCLRGQNEYECMILLKNWVYNKLTYSFNSSFPDLRNSLAILEKSKQGNSFLCSSYAALYMQCALSMGWTSRYLFLKKKTGEMHAAVEVWSNFHDKWIYIDPTWNIHLEKDGKPLSLFEMREEWFKNGGRDVIFIFNASSNAEYYPYTKLPLIREDSPLWKKIPVTGNWLDYTHSPAWVARNNFFSQGDGTGRDLWERIYIIKDRHNLDDRRWVFYRRISCKPAQIYHRLNTCSAEITGKSGENELYNIELKHSAEYFHTPSFSHFLIKVGDGPWKISGDVIRLTDKLLKNGFSVRTVNTMGIAGKECMFRFDGMYIFKEY